nr:MAG TPA: hypothetical protein [Caudoviricetes sp.]
MFIVASTRFAVPPGRRAGAANLHEKSAPAEARTL